MMAGTARRRRSVTPLDHGGRRLRVLPGEQNRSSARCAHVAAEVAEALAVPLVGDRTWLEYRPDPGAAKPKAELEILVPVLCVLLVEAADGGEHLARERGVAREEVAQVEDLP